MEDDMNDMKSRRKSGMDSPTGDHSKLDQRKHSVAANLQAEMNKQKVLKTKQEREARRSALDNHHQYLIDFISFYTDQKPKEVEEFVIDSQEYLNLMENFFQSGGTRSIMFYSQDHDAPGPGNFETLLEN